MWTDTELAYLAGIIDGEGTLFIQRRMDNGTWTYWPRMQVANTNREVIIWLHKVFGGSMYDKPRKKHNPKWKLQYQWYSRISEMDKFLPLIIPYLIIKKPHAEIMMQFRKTFIQRSNRKLTDEAQAFRSECMAKIKHLNS
jgi:hypothetical protein